MGLGGLRRVQVIPSAEHCTFVAGVEPKVTADAFARLPPVNLTAVPPAVAPVVPVHAPPKLRVSVIVQRLVMKGVVLEM
jgi:hypothetical protein